MGNAAAKEPTMEDILSSIRKIIAEEGEVPDEMAFAQNQPAQDDNNQQMNVEPAAEAASVPDPQPSEEPEMQAPEETAEPVAVAGSLAQIAAGLQSEESPVVEPFRPLDEQRAEEEAQPDAAPAMASRSLADIAAAVKAMESQNEAAPAEQPAVEESAAVEQAAAVPEQPAQEPVAQEPVVQEQVVPEPPVAQVVEEVAPEPVAAPAPPPQAAPVSEQEATYVEMSQAISAPVGGEMVEAAPEPNYPVPSEEAEFKGALMSPGADSAVSDSFERLKRSMMDDLDAKTESIMRPLLREWLDENLPNMVERLVREEIERVARG